MKLRLKLPRGWVAASNPAQDMNVCVSIYSMGVPLTVAPKIQKPRLLQWSLYDLTVEKRPQKYF